MITRRADRDMTYLNASLGTFRDIYGPVLDTLLAGSVHFEKYVLDPRVRPPESIIANIYQFRRVYTRMGRAGIYVEFRPPAFANSWVEVGQAALAFRISMESAAEQYGIDLERMQVLPGRREEVEQWVRETHAEDVVGALVAASEEYDALPSLETERVFRKAWCDVLAYHKSGVKLPWELADAVWDATEPFTRRIKQLARFRYLWHMSSTPHYPEPGEIIPYYPWGATLDDGRIMWGDPTLLDLIDPELLALSPAKINVKCDWDEYIEKYKKYCADRGIEVVLAP